MTIADPTTVRATAMRAALAGLPDGPLTDAALAEHVHPLFARVMDADRAAGRIYLANHSLGRPADRMAEDVRRAVDAWYADLGDAWSHWMGLRERYRAEVGELIGWTEGGSVRADQVVPKTSAAQGLRAVLNALPVRSDGSAPVVVTTRGEFDSIDHVLKTYAHRGRARVVWVDGEADGSFRAGRVVEAIGSARSAHGRVDLVVVSTVLFVTGQVMGELSSIGRAAQEAGGYLLLDTYHAAGVIPGSLRHLGDGVEADFAIGGSYKYARGGPGACWLATRHVPGAPGVIAPGELGPIDTGWFAKADPFAYRRTEPPEFASGGDSWLEATPPVLVFAQALSGLEVANALGVGRMRAHNLDQQRRFGAYVAEAGGPPVARVGAEHGAFMLLHADHGPSTVSALAARGVVTDGRPCPVTGRWYVRVCPDVLTTDAELRTAAGVVASVWSGG